MLKIKNPQGVALVLVSFLPVLGAGGNELKTKPTQHAVRSLNAVGLHPDMILGRAQVPLDRKRKEKIEFMCSIPAGYVISAPNVASIYEVPVNFEKDRLGDKILHKFGMKAKKQDLRDWKELVHSIRTATKPVKIGIVGKYFETGDFALTDSYLSVIEAIKHASWKNRAKPEITWLSAEKYEKNPEAVRELKEYGGIIVPGGFGNRGTEGKIKAIEFCRKQKIPYLGLCLGLQLAVIEFARHVCGLKNATSTEFVSARQEQKVDPVIDVMPDQQALIQEKHYGGTMRLGAYRCRVNKNTIAFKAYGKQEISERHRHRYEVNNKYREKLGKKGMVMSGINPERDLVEIIELKNHPFFVGTQFHPEFKSRPLNPHPLFREFIKACLERRRAALKD